MWEALPAGPLDRSGGSRPRSRRVASLSPLVFEHVSHLVLARYFGGRLWLTVRFCCSHGLSFSIHGQTIASSKVHRMDWFTETLLLRSGYSGSAFVLLMNNDTYNGLSEEKRAWIDAVASDELSRGGGATYDKVAGAGLKLA